MIESSSESPQVFIATSDETNPRKRLISLKGYDGTSKRINNNNASLSFWNGPFIGFFCLFSSFFKKNIFFGFIVMCMATRSKKKRKIFVHRTSTEFRLASCSSSSDFFSGREREMERDWERMKAWLESILKRLKSFKVWWQILWVDCF